jgi:hypothetical protein
MAGEGSRSVWFKMEKPPGAQFLGKRNHVRIKFRVVYECQYGTLGG